MKTHYSPSKQVGFQPSGFAASAFTLVEVMVAILLGSIFFTAFYNSLSFGFASVKASREDLRATQILVEQMEQLRLAPFTSLQSFTTNICYDPANQANGKGGTAYTITVTAAAPTASDLTPPGMSAVVYYANAMRRITATATWTSGNVPLSRTLQTFAASNGIQSFVYKPQ